VPLSGTFVQPDDSPVTKLIELNHVRLLKYVFLFLSM